MERVDVDWQDGDKRVISDISGDFDGKFTEDQVNQISQAVHRAGNDVQIFTGREFNSIPSLLITDKLTDADEPDGMPAGYGKLFHQMGFSNAVPEIDRRYAAEGTTQEEGDFLYSLAVEEMTHALQADQLGLTGKTGKMKKMLGDYISSRFKDMPDFDAEGFSDWTAEHLGNFSFWNYREQQLTDAYETPIDQLAEEAGIELENERQRKGLEQNRDQLVERQLEAYTGHAFYKAFNELNGLDETIEEGFTPTRPGDIDRVLETIEESSVEPVLYEELIKPYWNNEELDWKY